MDALVINILLLMTSILFLISGIIHFAVLFAVIFILVMLFLRDPERKIQKIQDGILASADGKIHKITSGTHPSFKGRVNKVLIFMSPLDVHRNRAPITGKITAIEYIPGKFSPAYKKGIENLNEKNKIEFSSARLKVVLTQIAGILARRIICKIKKGDKITQGSQFGLIKFGSANELVFPAAYKVCVKKNEMVKAGISIIARKSK